MSHSERKKQSIQSPEVVGLCPEVRDEFSDRLTYLLPAMNIVLVSLQFGHFIAGKLEIKDIEVFRDTCRRDRLGQRIETLGW